MEKRLSKTDISSPEVKPYWLVPQNVLNRNSTVE